MGWQRAGGGRGVDPPYRTTRPPLERRPRPRQKASALPVCQTPKGAQTERKLSRRLERRVKKRKVALGSTVLESSSLIHAGKTIAQRGKTPCKRARGRPCQNRREMGRVHRRRVDTPRKAGGTRPPACAHHGGQEKRWLAWWAATATGAPSTPAGTAAQPSCGMAAGRRKNGRLLGGP